MLDWGNYDNFRVHEFACHGQDCCGGLANMDEEFMEALQMLRSTVGKPFKINSGYRCPKHNEDVGGGLPHPTGKAADIHAGGEFAHDIIKAAMRDGRFQGFGFKQKGKFRKRFLHLDTIKPGEIPEVERPRLWSY